MVSLINTVDSWTSNIFDFFSFVSADIIEAFAAGFVNDKNHINGSQKWANGKERHASV